MTQTGKHQEKRHGAKERKAHPSRNRPSGAEHGQSRRFDYVLLVSRWGLCRSPKRGFLDAADFSCIQLREREALAPEVFQRRPDEVEFLVVDDEKAVVEHLAEADGQLGILRVERSDVGL